MTRTPFKLVACARIFNVTNGGVNVATLKPHGN